AGYSSMEEIYQDGALVETKDVTRDKTKDTVGARESQFPGGVEGWQKYLARNLKVPDEVVNNVGNFSGGAIVSFAVDKDGTIHDILLIKSALYLIDDVYLDIIKKSPKWLPAQINGTAVKSYKKQPFFLNIQ
ncbi:MAG TPA: hypothetical protein VMH01_02090, partial [Puia sp.]|nr:hypothetical protein [Puia sp.]